MTGIDDVLGDLTSLYGEDAIVSIKDVKLGPIHPSGVRALDAKLGIGGIPKGSVIEVYGEESSGKTSTALAMVKNYLNLFPAQFACIVDSENSITKEYLADLGFDIENPNLKIISPPGGVIEAAIDMMQKLMQTGEVSCMVLDSLNAAQTKKRMEAEVGDALIGNKAKMMSDEMPALRAFARKNECTLIIINQLRDKIGFMQSGKTTSGGNAVKFYADLRLLLKKPYGKLHIKQGDEPIGGYHECRIDKNKFSKNKGKFLIPIINGDGISEEIEIIDAGIHDGFIKKAASWYKMTTESGKKKDMLPMGQGLSKAIQFLKDNPEVMQDLKTKIENHVGN